MASPGLGQFQPLKLASPLSHIIWKGFRVCYVHKVWAGGHENVKHFCRLKREEMKSTEFKLQLPSDLAETIFWKDKSMQRFLNLVFEQNVLEASVVEKMSLKIAKGKKKKKHVEAWEHEAKYSVVWWKQNWSFQLSYKAFCLAGITSSLIQHHHYCEVEWQPHAVRRERKQMELKRQILGYSLI